VDIFMDCPRASGGWLCDSFFTSRVAFDLCGNTTIEKNFFENYLLRGVLPTCGRICHVLPADHKTASTSRTGRCGS